MSKFSDINKFDLAQIRADINEMATEELGHVVFFPSDSDGVSRYSHLDTLNLFQFQQGGYVNTYCSKASLVALWAE